MIPRARVAHQDVAGGRSAGPEEALVHVPSEFDHLGAILAEDRGAVCRGVEALKDVGVVDILEEIEQFTRERKPAAQEAHQDLGGAISQEPVRAGEEPSDEDRERLDVALTRRAVVMLLAPADDPVDCAAGLPLAAEVHRPRRVSLREAPTSEVAMQEHRAERVFGYRNDRQHR